MSEDRLVITITDGNGDKIKATFLMEEIADYLLKVAKKHKLVHPETKDFFKACLWRFGLLSQVCHTDEVKGLVKLSNRLENF
jgi:hypothetical protein